MRGGLKETDVSFFFFSFPSSLPPSLPPQHNLVNEHYFQVIWSLWTLSSERALVCMWCTCMNSLWAQCCTAASQHTVNRDSSLELKSVKKKGFLLSKFESLNYCFLSLYFGGFLSHSTANRHPLTPWVRHPLDMLMKLHKDNTVDDFWRHCRGKYWVFAFKQVLPQHQTHGKDQTAPANLIRCFIANRSSGLRENKCLGIYSQVITDLFLSSVSYQTLFCRFFFCMGSFL